MTKQPVDVDKILKQLEARAKEELAYSKRDAGGNVDRVNEMGCSRCYGRSEAFREAAQIVAEAVTYK